MKGIIKEYLHETKTLISWLEEQWTLLEELGNQCINVIQRGGTLYFCGNGGSAAQANHIVTELVGRFEKERRGFRAHSLSTNLSLVTALSNDYSFYEVFARQVETLMETKDLLVVISTSGRSSNILKAAQTASQ
ncbi:MAG: SIS domain-containing protein, partial [Planctomycetota bacterium]